MFDPDTVIVQNVHLMITHLGIGDVAWKHRSRTERYNPLRYEVRIKVGAIPFHFNKDGNLLLKWFKFTRRIKHAFRIIVESW